MKTEYGLDFIAELGKTQFQEVCDECDGTGIDLDTTMIILAPGVGAIIGGTMDSCVPCDGRGWNYILCLN